VSTKIHPSWEKQLKDEFEKPYFKQLTEFIKDEYKKSPTFPPQKDIFRAFDLCPFKDVKVVILGQDPYHGPNQANGLCFSVNENTPLPPSLQNIYKEIHSDLQIPTPTHGNLEHWARQGVLLLNATLTVRAHQAGSHQSKGWEQFTDAAIKALAENREHLVFLLWGAYAQKKGAFIDQQKHHVLKAPHPSPLSSHRGFFGCKHFSKANQYLTSHNITPINWA